jgi:cobalt-zinc-cadmium efflux system outer membrane protein
MFFTVYKKYCERLWLFWVLIGLLTLAGPGFAAPSVEDLGHRPGRISETPAGDKAILGLEDVLNLVFLNNPRLGSAYSAIRAQQGRMLQAGLLPNPTLSLELENIGTSNTGLADESFETSFLLGQLIEIGGQRGFRKDVAHHSTRSAQSDYAEVRLAIIAETMIAFSESLAQQISLKQAEEKTEIARALLGAVRIQVDNGAISAAEIPRAEIEVSLQEIEVANRARSLRAAFRRLASLWGADAFNFSRLRGVLDSSEPLPSLENFTSLLETSVKQKKLVIDIDRARSVMALEDSRRIPDLRLGLGPKYFSGNDVWGLQMGFEFPIPVFDRNQGARMAARAELAAAQDKQRGAKMASLRDLIRAHEAMSNAHDEAATLAQKVIPQARDAYAAMRWAHREGAVGLTDVLDAQRSLFLLQSRLVEVQKIYRISRTQTHLIVSGPALKDPQEEP